MLFPVHIPAVANLDHEDSQHIVFDSVKNPVIPLPDAILAVSGRSTLCTFSSK